MNFQKRIKINIIEDIIKRPDALSDYLGEEVSLYLADKLEKITEPTLIIIDLRKANPTDYLFISYAFGNFYSQIATNENYDAIFLIKKSHEKHLYWGLLAHIEKNAKRTGNFKDDFKNTNHIKISIQENKIEFISNLTDNEIDILNFINENREIDSFKLIDSFKSKIDAESITDATKSLKSKKFIYSNKSIPSETFFAVKI
jgi:hypothetical protein